MKALGRQGELCTSLDSFWAEAFDVEGGPGGRAVSRIWDGMCGVGRADWEKNDQL